MHVVQVFVIGLLALVACAGSAFVVAVVVPSRLVLWLRRPRPSYACFASTGSCGMDWDRTRSRRRGEIGVRVQFS